MVVRESQTGEILHTLIGHSADVVSIAFSPDSRRLATASYDRTVKIWDMQTGQDVFTLLGHSAGVISLAFSPDGHQLVSGGIEHNARVWNATPLDPHVIAEHGSRFRQKFAALAAAETAQRLLRQSGNKKQDWVVLKPARSKTEAGSNLALQQDGSITIEKPSQESQDAIHWQPGPKSVQALRIETSTRSSADRVPIFNEYQIVAASMASSRSGALRGRFVRLDLPGENSQFPRLPDDADNKFINLSEMQVFKGDQNIALNKRARASTSDRRLFPERAVDGNTVGNDETNSYAHTWDGKDPWWEVDLGSGTGDRSDRRLESERYVPL